MIHLFVRWAVVVAALGVAVFDALGQAPPNDQFVNAITINGPVARVTGSNVGATKPFGPGGGEPSIPPPSLGTFGGASVWWNWTATASGETTIDTEGSSFDTLLGVYTGDEAPRLTLVAGNNDFGGNSWSRVVFNAVGGTTYRIMVDGFRSGPGFGAPATGTIVLNVKGVGGVDVLSPTPGAIFTVGDNVPVAISINSDFPNPPASRVDFYARGTLFASRTAPPFSAIASNLPAGSNAVYAVAYDSLGGPIQSPVVTVFVQSIGVTLLTPFEDTMYLNQNPITVTAWGYLPTGTFTKVEFFVDGVKFGEDTAPPYSATWSNVIGGSHRFTAVGRSDTGTAYNSQAINVGVATTLLASNSVWKYLDDGSDQGTAWSASDFDDSAWASGPAPLGYSDSNGRLPLTTNSFGPNANAKFTTTYFRQAFVASNVAGYASIPMNIQRDDGAIVYLNGAEVGRFNMPTGVVTSATFASANAGDDGGTTFTVPLAPGLFRNGTNVFAVEIHQDAGNSSDIWFVMELLGLPVIIHNVSPVVALTTPPNGQSFRAPASVTLEATASDEDGTVARVEFYVDGVKIGEDATAPYSATWNNPTVAAHVLTAVAIDDQNGAGKSAEVPVVVYDAVGHPVTRIASPANGATMDGPTNLVVTATAYALTGPPTVVFRNNGVPFATNRAEPYSTLWTAPFGRNVLTVVATDANGLSTTSSVVRVIINVPPINVVAPTVVSQIPLRGATTNTLSSVTVRFSEYVQNVDAADLLINGVPATGVDANHSRSNYVFTFPQPAYGQVVFRFAADHGITDYGYPTVLPLDANGASARWTNTLVDQTLPIVASRVPAAGAIVTNLSLVTVNFSEPVTGVDASDLLINGVPAQSVSGQGTNFVFQVAQPAPGTVNVTWAVVNDIVDRAPVPNAFNRSNAVNNWTFTLDTRFPLIQSNSTWLFIKGTNEASEPRGAWRQLTYNDSGWSNAPAPFFYGETALTNANIMGTTLSDMQSNYTSIYLRKEFTVLKRGEITNLLISAQVDDGFIAWLNGVEVARVLMPTGEVAFNAVATAQVAEPANNGAAYTVYTLTNAVRALVSGRNVLAVHAFNQSLTASSDFSFNAQLYYFPLEVGTVPPRLLDAAPTQGDVFALTNVTVTFSEGVQGVDATDLLVNGVPATGLNSTTNTTYTFSFPQPPYGNVVVTWVTNHGITDFDTPTRAFNETNATATLRYFLNNPSNPTVATQDPLRGSSLTDLTAVVVTFNEPVAGVDASDLLVSGTPASGVTTQDNVTYRFTFTQPPFGLVAISWVTNHGIADVEAGNAFEPTRFGGQWNYTLIDPVPAVTITNPTNNTSLLPPASTTVRATATDIDGTVARIELFQDGIKLGEGTNSPFAVGVSNLDLGRYTFRAVATDNLGLTRTSAPVIVNVVTSLPIALVRGPYLNSGSPTGGVVRWRTDVVSDGLVWYGTDVNNLTNWAQETSVTNEHIVTLTGLAPDTKYYYSIGSAAYRLVGGVNDGENYWFKTSPPVGTRRPIRFWALGDAGTAGNGSPDRQRSTRDAFYSFAATNGGPTDLMLLLGDNAYNSGTDSEYQAAIFDMYPTTLRNKFLWPALGNHETSQSTTVTDFPYLHMFSLPKGGEAGGVPSGTELYYSFDYGNIHFVCLDSMTSGRTNTTPMAQWLVNDLENTAQEWVVVFFHHSLYTKGTHDSDAENDLVELRENIFPILESHSVDIVLMGHSHVYERSYLLDGHYGLSRTFSASMKVDDGSGRENETGAYHKNEQGRGVVYTIAGNAGQALGGPLNHPAHYVSINELGTVVIDVSGNRLDAKFLNASNVVRDTYTLLKPTPVPNAPENLVALPASGTEINLTWSDVANNESGYAIERSADGINFTEILTVAAGATSARDLGLTANTSYFYRVRGTNSLGTGDYSSVAGASTVAPTTRPNPPVGLVATASDGFRFFRSQMVLRWQDRSTNEAAFQIERSDGTTFTPIATVPANVSSYVDRHLASATRYDYRVRAVNALGPSAPSNAANDETHPQSQLVRMGESVTFHAGAEGVAPLRYQWQFKGAFIAGQTNETLQLANVQPGQEGDYQAVIRDADGRRVSNPAYLLVLSAPTFVAQPSDLVAVAGTSVSLSASVDGNAPFTYQWRKNGSLLPGATSPTLTFPNVQLSDAGRYELVAANNFGTATSRTVQLEVFVAPALAAVPRVYAEVLRPLVVTNVVTDPNVPPLQLTYSLAPGAPTNATIHPTTGDFRWTPTRGQAPSSNWITARVADAIRPLVSGSASFAVLVNDYLELTAGSLIVQVGESNSVPLDLYSSAAVSELHCVLRFPENRLTNLWLEPLAADLVDASLQPTGAGAATLTCTVLPGEILQGALRVARLHFTAVSEQTSGFAPLHLDSMSATAMVSGVEPTLLVNDARIVIVGAQPMIEARIKPVNQREITLYGKRATTYLIEATTNLAGGGTWTRRGTIVAASMTNLFQTQVINTPVPPVYFRVRQQ